MSCSDSLGSLLDGFGAGDGLDSLDDIMKNNWDQPGVDASQLGTPHNHGVFNPGSMHVEPPQLPPHQGSFMDEYGAAEEEKQFLDDILCSDQPEVDASQCGTPHNHGVFNPGSMHVEPPQLPPHQASALQFWTPPSHAPLNPESMAVHPPPLAQQPGTSQPSNIANAADAEKKARIQESKRKSREKKETERKEKVEKLEKENHDLREVNASVGKELSNLKEEVSRLNNKLEDQTMQIIDEMAVKINEAQERINAEMAVKINEAQERIRAEINEGQERIRAEINEGQERIRAGQKEERIRAGQRYLKRIRAEMVGAETNEAQERIRAGQRYLKRIRAEMVGTETNEAQERIRAGQRSGNQVKSNLKARSENDASKDAALTQILWALLRGEAEHELKRAEHERRSKNKD